MLTGIRRVISALFWRLRCFWAAIGAGSRNKAVLEKSQLQRLLVVCYGNIYRSPYVAEMLRSCLAGVSEVHSSGFHATAGRKSPPPLIAFALTYGVNLAEHRSSVIAPADLVWADAIILMDRHNWQALRKLGSNREKMIWLGALDHGGDIPDPYGMPEDQVRKVIHRINRCTEALAAEILARRGLPPSKPLAQLE